MATYNLKSYLGRYQITKFDEDFNVESSYTCTESECNCPASRRYTCRHREMVPIFVGHGRVDSKWFYDYDRGKWIDIDGNEQSIMQFERRI